MQPGMKSAIADCLAVVVVKARGYACAKIEYVSVRAYLSKNRIRV